MFCIGDPLLLTQVGCASKITKLFIARIWMWTTPPVLNSWQQPQWMNTVCIPDLTSLPFKGYYSEVEMYLWSYNKNGLILGEGEYVRCLSICSHITINPPLASHTFNFFASHHICPIWLHVRATSIFSKTFQYHFFFVTSCLSALLHYINMLFLRFLYSTICSLRL